ncbi:hypothetical protein B0H13DRAFT_1871085 [Mycena leptocephala]|nr:hypothetical protein B0H13DRAFT_1871085 [Mycena leptocephala]
MDLMCGFVPRRRGERAGTSERFEGDCGSSETPVGRAEEQDWQEDRIQKVVWIQLMEERQESLKVPEFESEAEAEVLYHSHYNLRYSEILNELFREVARFSERAIGIQQLNGRLTKLMDREDVLNGRELNWEYGRRPMEQTFKLVSEQKILVDRRGSVVHPLPTDHRVERVWAVDVRGAGRNQGVYQLELQCFGVLDQTGIRDIGLGNGTPTTDDG